MSGVMADIKAIEKNQVNSHQRYRFRGIDDVYNALNPALVKNKVFIAPIYRDIKREEVRG